MVLEVGPRICISKKSSGDANAACPEITLWEPLFRPMLLKAFGCFNMHTSFPNTLLNANWFWFSRSSTGLCDSALLTSSQIILLLLVHISYFGYQGNRMKSVDFEFRENWAFGGGGGFFVLFCFLPHGMWDLSSWPRMKLVAPALEAESEPLDHQGSPKIFF